MFDSNLFSPIQIRRTIHRVVMAPLTCYRANKACVHGELAVEYYGQHVSVSIMVYQAPFVNSYRYLNTQHSAHHRSNLYRTRSW